MILRMITKTASIKDAPTGKADVQTAAGKHRFFAFLFGALFFFGYYGNLPIDFHADYVSDSLRSLSQVHYSTLLWRTLNPLTQMNGMIFSLDFNLMVTQTTTNQSSKENAKPLTDVHFPRVKS